MSIGWILMEVASDAISQNIPRKKITPRYYAWICLAFALFILVGIAGALYTVLRRNIGSIQRRWYSWCLFCDKRSRDMNLQELGSRKSYDTFASSYDTAKKDYVMGMYSGSDLPKEWTPLPGGLKRSGSSCPNIKFDSSFGPFRSLRVPKRSSSASASASRKSTLVVIEENEEEYREDLFL
mmetsp:Transcript_8982/g.17098  ORF Transcript_8982/g.17098 Transcript_8982/m.17098 type:complete len:181 (-) Transcript_8982:65-607(-)|eukprot:CAMPEP_0167803856 /NCGR_PEP_ID=MMETSP0111_2-20121227/20112_1 /TAXON_ID=91324 /ORGANISM="Lotharella globosa, Strain CCCM811" /LENGTH=180 /DNA_ID=CAMNT_0007700459 /DNA_START=39 /DNA_END=581 /DNA_ORIENTATION=+